MASVEDSTTQVDESRITYPLTSGPQPTAARDQYMLGTFTGIHNSGEYQQFQASFGGTPAVFFAPNTGNGTVPRVVGTPTSGSFQAQHDAAGGSIDGQYLAFGPR